MRLNLASGAVAGVLLASLLVLASSGFSGPSTAGPLRSAGGLVQYTTAQTVTMTASSTSTATQTGAGSVNIPSAVSGLATSTTTVSTTSTTAAFQAIGVSASTSEAQSSLATLVRQPTSIPLVLVPVILALVVGLVLFRVTRQED